MGASVNQITVTRARLTTACTEELNTSGRVFAYAEIWGYSQMLAIYASVLMCCVVLCMCLSTSSSLGEPCDVLVFENLLTNDEARLLA